MSAKKPVANVDDLIASLSDELEPVKTAKHPLFYALPWLAVALAFSVYIIYRVGIRHDALVKLHDTVFLFETILVGALGISAAIASGYLMVPDMRGKKWLVSVTATIAVVFLLWNVVKSFAEGLHMPHLNIDHCMQEGLFIAFIPMMALIFFMRGGTTTRPMVMALMNILAGASIAYIGLRFTCSMDTVGHSTIMHLAPYIVVGSLIGLTARRLYKW